MALARRVWVSGSIAYDRIMDYPGRFASKIDPTKAHILNVSFVVPSVSIGFGGTAANIAYSLSLLKVKTSMVGSVGEDGGQYLARLKNLGIDMRFVTTAPKLQTASAYIITDRDDNQVSAFIIGAMGHAPTLPPAKKGELAIVSSQGRHTARLASHYRKLGVDYIFDPGQALTSLSRSEFRSSLTGARIIISNDYELSYIFRFASYSPNSRQIVVTTKGPKGSVISSGRHTWNIPPARVKKAVDPTGAGDAYRAGFIKGFISAYSWEKTGRLASVVAAYAVEKQGTQSHTFTWPDIKKRYNKSFKHRLD